MFIIKFKSISNCNFLGFLDSVWRNSMIGNVWEVVIEVIGIYRLELFC